MSFVFVSLTLIELKQNLNNSIYFIIYETETTKIYAFNQIIT